MDSIQRKLLLFGAISCVHLAEALVLVRAPSPLVASLGDTPLSLECAYRVTGSDSVISVNWYRKGTNEDSLMLIAQVPNKNMDLPPTIPDRRLATRGNITVRKIGIFDVVKLHISPVDCTDGGEYECEVIVYNDQTPYKAKVQVSLNEKPSGLSLTHDAPVLTENRPVTFTCTATMGRPAGTFRWLVYTDRAGSPLEEAELTGVTHLDELAGSCSPKGTSTLAIMVNRADRKVKCVVEQQGQKGVVQVSEELKMDVKYRVTDIEVYARVGITDLPISSEVLVQQGDDVYLLCISRGNPRPDFTWSYLPLGGSKSLSPMVTQPDLVLNKLAANQSGSYVCVATNCISNVEYTDTKSVRILVQDKVAFEKRKVVADNDTVGRYLLIGGVVTGALLFTVFISLLSVICVRRCSQKPDIHQIRYTGVNE